MLRDWTRPIGFAFAVLVVSTAVARADSEPGGVFGSRLGFNLSAIDWNDAAHLSANVDTMMAGIAGTGAKWVRFDIAWWDVDPTHQPNASLWRWSTTDLVVDSAVAHGLSPIVVPYSAPCWAAEVPAPKYCSTACVPFGQPGYDANCVTPWNGHFAAAVANDYQNFVTQVGVRYLDRVSTWELWNEPNTAQFYGSGPNPARYVSQVLIPGANALRAAQTWLTAVDGITYPLRILTGGTAPSATGGGNYSPVDFLVGIYNAGGGSYFDGVAHHPYSFPYPPETIATWNAFTQTDDLNAVLRFVGQGAKKIWATEIGFPTQAGVATPTGACDNVAPGSTLDRCVDEATQGAMADLAVRAWVSRSFTGPMIWFNYRDGSTGLQAEDKFGWGVVRQDAGWTAKPVRQVFTTLATYPLLSVGQPGLGTASPSDPPGNAAEVVEGDTSASRNLFTTLSLSAGAPSAISVTCATANGTAVAPGDYAAKSAGVNIPVGKLSNTFSVGVKGDTASEAQEKFTVGCTSATVDPVCQPTTPSGGADAFFVCTVPSSYLAPPLFASSIATALISNDDPTSASTEVSIGDAWIAEGDVDSPTASKQRVLTFTITASKAAPSGGIAVNVNTAGGSASSGTDFVPLSTTATIPGGRVFVRLAVKIKGDLLDEADETFTVSLSGAPSGVVFRKSTATGTIVDDDY